MIYFVRNKADGHIKIGTTIRLSQRLKDLSRIYGELEVLGVMGGSYEREAELHRCFSPIHVVLEWFQADDELLKFISQETSDWDGTDEVEARDETSVRLDVEALKRAKIAAAFQGESLPRYLSRIVMEQADKEIDEWAEKWVAAKSK